MKTLKWSAIGLSKLVGVGAIAMIAAAGCGNKDDSGDAGATNGQPGNTTTGKSVDQNFGDTGNAVAGAAGNVAGAAGNVAGAAGNEVVGAGNVVSNGAGKMGVAVKNAGTAAVTTPSIKTALGASKAMDGSDVNVDTTATTVTLKGTVKSAMQKSMAGTIAKSKAGGLKVVNNLTVKK